MCVPNIEMYTSSLMLVMLVMMVMVVVMWDGVGFTVVVHCLQISGLEIMQSQVRNSVLSIID